MSDPPPPCSLSVESVKVILEAACPAVPLSPNMVETTRRWLEDALERAIRRVQAKPLTQKDVSRLDHAYTRFRYVVQQLQDRRNPPPPIPTRDGQTDWDYWITTHRTLKSKRGHPEKVDWHFIGELIAVYEVTSDRAASGSKPAGPTVLFLEVALGEIRNYVPEEARSYFQVPGVGVLRAKLGVLHTGYFRFLREELNRLVEKK